MDNEVLDVKALRSYLGIGRDKAYALMKTNGFPSIKIGSQYIVRKESLDKYLSKYEGKEIIIY